MSATAAVQVKTPDKDFVLTRTFDAPRALVFKEWTDPRQLARWWGPRGFTNPVCQMDLRPGGAFRVVMRGPDGAEYPLKGVFLEIDAPERLVMTMDLSEHPAEWLELYNQYRGKRKDAPAMKIVTTVTFEEQDGGTKLTVAQRFDSVTDRDANMKLGAAAGWSQSFERLDELLRRPQ